MKLLADLSEVPINGGMSYFEIAKRLGTTSQEIERIERRALRKLRTWLWILGWLN